MSRTKPTYITGARLILNKIKGFQDVKEDQELAALFPVSRGTISNWLREDRIPTRYERTLDQLQTVKVTPGEASRRVMESGDPAPYSSQTVNHGDGNLSGMQCSLAYLWSQAQTRKERWMVTTEFHAWSKAIMERLERPYGAADAQEEKDSSRKSRASPDNGL